MKKIFLNLAVVFMAVLALNACKSEDGPEAVAEKYLKHVANQEWDAAKKLGTESTVQMLEMTASMMSEFGGEATTDVKIEDMNCTVDGTEAKCTFKQNGETDKLDLVKVDGKWLVDQKKEMGDDMWEDDDDMWDEEWDEDWDDEALLEETTEDLVEEIE